MDRLVKDHRGLRRRPLYSPILLVIVSLAVAAVLVGWLATGWGTTTVLLTRHAEKEAGEDAGLSETGRARADALADMLADAGVDAVFVSELRRTQETAAPLANAAGVAPVVMQARDTDSLVRRLKEHHKGEVVLVVGHSNTVPVIARGLGAEIGAIGEDDYGAMWLVSYSRLRGTRMLELRY